MVYLFLADGFEEIEAVCTVDILRRCGVDVKTVSVMKDIMVTGAHGILLKADMSIENISDNGDMYVLPGGMTGVENMAKCNKLCEILKSTSAYIAAICAAPTLIASLGLLKDKKAICYPSLENELHCAKITSQSVVTDGRVITSMGPGTSFDFGFEIAGLLIGKEVAESVKNGMLVK
ncbi:MAG: DJ-1/PfpI family protein [Clostridia bacterium]|nr:DJ-1/PfpI family protein [Clostridia bacterium]